MSNENQTFLRHDWSQIERVFYMTAPAPCPYLPNRILQELAHMLDTDGATRLDQIKGQITDPVEAIKHSVGLYEGLSK